MMKVPSGPGPHGHKCIMIGVQGQGEEARDWGSARHRSGDQENTDGTNTGVNETSDLQFRLSK